MSEQAHEATIFAVTTQKGGAGKTTIVIAVALTLIKRGYRVLVIDLDRQKHSLKARAIALSQGQSFADVIVPPSEDIPALLSEHLEQYDVIIFDCPGDDYVTVRQALCFTDVAIMPMKPSILDADSLDEWASVLGEAMVHNPELTLRPVVTFVQHRRRRLLRAIPTKMADFNNRKMKPFATQIHDRVEYIDMIELGQHPAVFSPGCKAGVEIDNFVTELLSTVPQTTALPAPSPVVSAAI